jgi:hypothetical protein
MTVGSIHCACYYSKFSLYCSKRLESLVLDWCLYQLFLWPQLVTPQKKQCASLVIFRLSAVLLDSAHTLKRIQSASFIKTIL